MDNGSPEYIYHLYRDMQNKCECGFVYCYVNMLGQPDYCSIDCQYQHQAVHARYEQEQKNGLYKGKICPSCEQRINVTDHVCKQKDTSKDWLDVLKDLP